MRADDTGYTPSIMEHLRHHPSERSWLSIFRRSFKPTHVVVDEFDERKLTLYLLKPTGSTSRRFGWHEEIPLIFPHTQSLSASHFALAERTLAEPEIVPRRVNRHVLLVVTLDAEAHQEVAEFYGEQPDRPAVALLTVEQLLSNEENQSYLTRELSRQLFAADIFDIRLPLRTDAAVFGRQSVFLSVLDLVRQGENVGIFGLRKTGKTSLLLKLQRHLAKKRSQRVEYIDCKSLAIEEARWTELLERIYQEVVGSRLPPYRRHRELVASFSEGLNDWLTGKKKRLVLMFDEFESISPFSVRAPHWKEDFVVLWRVLGAYQSEHRNVSFIFAGVSAAPVETARFGGVQNPLFAIVSPKYLTGFDRRDLEFMLATLGRACGLAFSEGAVSYLAEQYAGHPLLTRLACSHAHQALDSVERPYELSEDFFLSTEEERNRSLLYYGPHVLDELKEFYPDEYEMLALLARNDRGTFEELTRLDEGLTLHLRRYGLLDEDSLGRPEITIPILRRYIALSEARKLGGLLQAVVPPADRPAWVNRVLDKFLLDFRLLERQLKADGSSQLAGGELLRTDQLLSVGVVAGSQQWAAFINTINKSIVEAIERHGREHLDDRSYFWEVRKRLPTLGDSLLRVKVYRNEEDHTELIPDFERLLAEFTKRDLRGVSPRDADYWFIRQQVLLDNLACDLQIELARVLP